jgi:hypothetical protein
VGEMVEEKAGGPTDVPSKKQMLQYQLAATINKDKHWLSFPLTPKAQ